MCRGRGERGIEPVVDFFNIKVGQKLRFRRGQREIVNCLAWNELLREELNLVFVDFALSGLIELTSLPTDDNVAFKRELFQKPLVVFRFLKVGGEPVFDRVRVAFQRTARAHQDETQQKYNDEDDSKTVCLIKIFYHRLALGKSGFARRKKPVFYGSSPQNTDLKIPFFGETVYTVSTG